MKLVSEVNSKPRVRSVWSLFGVGYINYGRTWLNYKHWAKVVSRIVLTCLVCSFYSEKKKPIIISTSCDSSKYKDYGRWWWVDWFWINNKLTNTWTHLTICSISITISLKSIYQNFQNFRNSFTLLELIKVCRSLRVEGLNQ